MNERIADVLLGTGDPAAPALHDGERTWTHAELAAQVARRSDELQAVAQRERGVVLLSGAPSAEWITTYLAILASGHVPLLAGERHEVLERAWAPTAVVQEVDGELRATTGEQTGPRPALHPELALLLSTSGSTGSPKLVRLSHANLVANATAIASSLGLGAGDVGITSLPLHYCYGLSVLHAHLAVGASLVATRASVVDPCFVAALERHGVTSIAGVPHTFDLLEAAGPERIATSSLRLLTQAGGRLGGAARARWRERAAAWGVNFVVMYGQTEATARMAYLPPALAAQAGDRAVGVPVPGGSLDVVPVEGEALGEDGVGELVFRGPNVMMGYGVEPADLSLGSTLGELRTGDLGRFDPVAGVYEVVGRRSRFTKPFGLRIDLDGVEATLREAFGEAVVGGDDERLVVVAPGRAPAEVVAAAAAATGLPAAAVHVVVDRPVPRTATGKVDLAAVDALAPEPAPAADDHGERTAPSAVIARVLGRRDVAATDTFATAGGDSLSYVEASMRLEALVGSLPDGWQHLTMAELDGLAPSRRRARVDTTVALRALGIAAVVATHMKVGYLAGGAHLLLAVAGYNLARFNLDLASARDRVGATTRTLGRVVVPTVAVALVVLAMTDRYGWSTVGLVNNYLGPRHHEGGHWHFWFIEAFVQLTVVVTAVLAIPVVRRAERARPYAFAVGALAVALALRELTWWGIDDPYNLRFRTHGVAAFFVLGWVAQRATTTTQRVATSALAAVVTVGFFGEVPRESFVLLGVLALLWARSVPMPRVAIPVVASLAAASMWILISHFHVWPVLVDRLPLAVAYPATLAIGVAVWQVAERVPRALAPRRGGGARRGSEADPLPVGAVEHRPQRGPVDDRVVEVGRLDGLAEEDRPLGDAPHDDAVAHGGVGDVPAQVAHRPA